MKKLLPLLLALVLVLALAACSAPQQPGDERQQEDSLLIGVILVGAEDDNGYNYNHIAGLKTMQDACNITDEQIIYKANVSEDAACGDAVRQLAEAGCDVIFSNSFGHEAYLVAAADDYPAIQFCPATGNLSATDGRDNTHNFFAKIHEARYLSGIAAGMKLNELGSTRLGYVGAKPLPEVISGFTAFYLGAKSVCPGVVMDVIYTNEWNDAALEAQAAQTLIDNGAMVVGQHSDTTAPAATAQANGVFHVGYNADMIAAAPDASLLSPRINWGVYYTYAINCLLSGEAIAQDWCQGLDTGAVYLSPLNTAIAAAGTQDALDAAQAALLDGSLQVFAGPLTDQDGKLIVAAGEFFDEGSQASAPAWDHLLAGVTVIH